MESILFTLTYKLYTIIKTVKTPVMAKMIFLKLTFLIAKYIAKAKRTYSKKVKEEYKNTLVGL